MHYMVTTVWRSRLNLSDLRIFDTKIKAFEWRDHLLKHGSGGRVTVWEVSDHTVPKPIKA